MELINELLFTAFAAILLSFLVAKLVSMALGSDGGEVSAEEGVESGEEMIVEGRVVQKGVESASMGLGNDGVEVVVQEEILSGEKLQVEGFETQKGVEFVELKTRLVDQFQEEEKSIRGDEVEVAEAVELPEEKKSGVDDVSVEKVADCEDATDDSGTNTTVLDGEIEAKEGDDGKEEAVISSDEDGWEGIERSELDEDFAAAAKFVGGGDKGSSGIGIGNDMEMQLYGLHKVAMEGPCHEPQPVGPEMSDRAKWNAWQKLGNMNPDVAMEQYIALLSDKVPGWMEDSSSIEGQSHAQQTEIPGIPDPDSTTTLDRQPNITNESESKLKSEAEDVDTSRSSNSLVRDKE